MTAPIEVDVALIGAGSAGVNARRAVMAAGKSLVVFDPGPLGTTCASVGCMPSKLLIAAADHKHAVDKAADFGVEASATVDPVAVMTRVRRLRDQFVAKTVKGIARVGTPIPAAAKFVGPNLLEADGKQYRVGATIIATGSVPITPGPWKAAADVILTNEQVFELERLPASLLVVGAGAIGLELGQAMHRLGVRVHVLDVSGLLGGLDDPAMIEVVRRSLGIAMDLKHTLDKIEMTDAGVRVQFTGEDGSKHDDVWQYVLMAAGRAPRTAGLDLAAAGLDPLPPIDPATGRVGNSAVYMAGDVTGSKMILHEAAHEGVIAGTNAALHPEQAPEARKTPLGVVFTDPQIARVGERGEVAMSFDFANQSRAKVLGRNVGRMEIYANKDGTLTGALIVGPDAEHLAHLMAWIVQAGFDVDKAVTMPVYHPVLEEALQATFRRLKSKLKKLNDRA